MNEPNLFAFYNGTAGYAGSEASKARAVREAADGTLSERQAEVMEELFAAGQYGATWQQLAERLRLHHGQISGALSNLHKGAQVFMAKKMRERSHPYVHIRYRKFYKDDEVHDLPQTSPRREREILLNELQRLCNQAVRENWNYATCLTITSVLDRLNEYEQRTGAQR